MTLSISLSTMSPYAVVVSVLGVQSNHARVGQVRAQDMFVMAPIRTCEKRCGERRGQTGDGPWLQLAWRMDQSSRDFAGHPMCVPI